MMTLLNREKKEIIKKILAEMEFNNLIIFNCNYFFFCSLSSFSIHINIKTCFIVLPLSSL